MEGKGENILVLGAGTGGLVVGNLLAGKGYNVTIVERRGYHLFQPGMLWIAFQGHDPSMYMRRIEDLIRPNVKLVKATVEAINLEERQVRLSNGAVLGYDYLVIALGVSYNYDAIPGNKELMEAYGDFYSGPDSAVRLWENFSKLNKGKIVIAAADPLYKCPPAPHKAAFLASYTLWKKGLRDSVEVHLALPFIHEYPSETVAKIVAPKLADVGVRVHTLFTVDQINLDEKKIYSLEGEELEYDLAVVIPVHHGPEVNVVPDNVLDEDGYFKVDKYKLNVNGFDDVYAIGDCNNTPTSKTGVTAHLGAEVVAERIMGYDAEFTGRTNCPIVANGEATFVISSYNSPPIPVKFSRFKRLLEDLFIASYWSSLREPEKWAPVFRSYFKATDPEVLGSRGW